MTLNQARKIVNLCAEQMRSRYQKAVFDEWAIVAIGGSGGTILDYTGPRKADFRENFLEDAGTLRASLLHSKHTIGDFEFSRNGVGSAFESFMVLGDGVYLICNNTVQSMDTISQNPRWLGAQVPFVELSDRVRSDPVVLS